MIKSEFITALAAKINSLNETELTEYVNLLLRHISDNLAAGGRTEARDFGSFDVAYRKPRLAHNPKTLAKLQIDEKYSIHFRPGKELRGRVNESRHHVAIIEDTREDE